MGERYKVDADIEQYFELVGHNYKLKNHRRAEPFFRWLLDRISSRRECHGLQELYDARKGLPDDKKPVYIHVGRHLSELDWAEAQLLLYQHGMSSLVSMGDNLTMWPFGDFLKAMGGFVAIREETTIKGKRIDKKLAARIYSEYFHHVVINEGHDILVYPEWTHINSSEGRKRKYGRSYTGELLEFSPFVFRLLQNVQGKCPRPVMVVPHNASRERVVEDQIFRKLASMKERGCNNRAVYLHDLGFILSHWLYQGKGDVVFNFGEPIPVNGQHPRGLARRARKEVAKLQTLFPTHIVAYSIGDKEEMEVNELEHRVTSTLYSMLEQGFKVDCLSVDGTMDRAHKQFHQFLRRRKIITVRKGVVRVHRPDVLAQYRNNVVSLEQAIAEE